MPAPPPPLPSFETATLVLRPRTIADTDACLAMDREPGVTEFVSGPWSDPAAHRALVKARTRGPWPPGMGYWTITPRDDPGTFAGWVMLIPNGGTGPEIEIGWTLRPRFWGKGFATEAARPILDHAFDTIGLEEVIAVIAPANLASIRVAEKIGLRRQPRDPGQDASAVRYALRSTGGN